MDNKKEFFEIKRLLGDEEISCFQLTKTIDKLLMLQGGYCPQIKGDKEEHRSNIKFQQKINIHSDKLVQILIKIQNISLINKRYSGYKNKLLTEQKKKFMVVLNILLEEERWDNTPQRKKKNQLTGKK